MWWRLALPLVISFAPGIISRVMRTVYLAWKLTLDNRVPLILKLLVPASILYFVTPIARVPYVGLAGYLFVLWVAVSILFNLAPRHVVESYAPWRASRKTGSANKKEDSSRVVEGSYRLLDEEDPTEDKPK